MGLTPNNTDSEYMAKGWPCDQLMKHSTNNDDTVHPNELGREAIAKKIYSWMKEKNWI